MLAVPDPVRKAWRFFRRYPVIPVIILVVLIVLGVFAPWLAPQSPLRATLRDKTAPPTWLNSEWYEEHPKTTNRYLLGADNIGRDVLSRVMYGARVSLMVAVISMTSGIAVGTFLGLIAGYTGGWLDEAILRTVDVWSGLPFILVALVAVVILGQSFAVLMGLLALMAWASGVRNVRGEVLSLKERDYVALAKVSGASTTRILFIHILPGVINTVIVIATLRVGALILAEATLSFLGAGIPPPTPSWGGMVSDGRDYLDSAWWICFFPGFAIFLVVMSMNFLGDWFRDRFDPRLRQL